MLAIRTYTVSVEYVRATDVPASLCNMVAKTGVCVRAQSVVPLQGISSPMVSRGLGYGGV